MAMSIVDGSQLGINGLKWTVDSSQRAAMIFTALFCRNPNSMVLETETQVIKMLESGDWKDDMRFLGIPVITRTGVPLGTIRLEDDGGAVLGEISNLATPNHYYGH